MNCENPLTSLSGIGEKRAKAFSKLGIYNTYDLLHHYPRSYQNRGEVRMIKDGVTDKECSYILRVTTEPSLRRVRNMSILKFRAADESGVCEIVYFNQPYYKNQIHVGGKYRFFGRLTAEKSVYKLNSPKLDAVVEGVELENIIPIYPMCEGVTQRVIRDAVASAVAKCLPGIKDYLPESIRRENNLSTIQFALREIHRPTGPEPLERAMHRLRFDEMFIFGVAMRYAGMRMKRALAPRIKNTDVSRLLSVLPFALTGAQDRAVAEISSDMSRGGAVLTVPMSRIVSGDVGSGKTAVAAAAAFLAINNGYQAALMAPTEILAAQHYKELSGYFEKLGCKVALLTGSTTAAEKKKIYSALEAGGIDLAVGTHALIGEKVKFNRPGIFITDEQHRFGVMQRAALSEKANAAHVLVMSATPIPRTLALAMYGDLDLSVLDELPPGRQRVDTFAVDSSYRERLDAFIIKQVSEGHQCYVVCPAVEEDPEGDSEDSAQLSAAVEYSKALAARLPDLRVGCMHGRLSPKEKDAVMRDFAAGECDVLVSTTVIEVGVNVPNATLMIIENAERFGLSQLHQLRGRVGRGSAKAYCVLVSDAEGEKSRERLNVMKTTYDGYKIAERDLEMRGPGDFFATEYSARQHGGMKFRFAEGMSDENELKNILAAAENLIKSDPSLMSEENTLLREKVLLLAQCSESTVN